MHDLFLIIGRTASGKSSIANLVASEMNLSVLKSYTTRPMRPGEEHCSDHIFIKEDEFQIYKNSIVAYTEINGYKYFCTKNQLMKADIYVIDPDGYDFLSKQNIAGLRLHPIYISVDSQTRKERFIFRKGTESAFAKRNESESKQFDEFEKRDDIFRVENRNLRKSVRKVKLHILSKKNKSIS